MATFTSQDCHAATVTNMDTSRDLSRVTTWLKELEARFDVQEEVETNFGDDVDDCFTLMGFRENVMARLQGLEARFDVQGDDVRDLLRKQAYDPIRIVQTRARVVAWVAGVEGSSNVSGEVQSRSGRTDLFTMAELRNRHLSINTAEGVDSAAKVSHWPERPRQLSRWNSTRRTSINGPSISQTQTNRESRVYRIPWHRVRLRKLRSPTRRLVRLFSHKSSPNFPTL